MGFGGKLFVSLWATLGVLVLIGAMVQGPAPPETQEDRDRRSVGYLSPGQCMSGQEFNTRAQEVIGNTDWSQIRGSATMSAGTKSMIGAVKVFDEMRRLGTRACPDLAPLYERYLAAKNYQQPQQQTQAAPAPAASFPRVQLKTGGNIRRNPSTKAPVIRVAQQGDILRQFRSTNGWVQVGRDAPEGWVAQSVVSHLSGPQ